jgi:hypothetical protein
MADLIYRVVQIISNLYKGNAHRRGLDWNLSPEEVQELVFESCFYCGISPFRAIKVRGNIFYYNGIDRVDNKRGYFSDNVVSCCKTCNIAKSTMTPISFHIWAKNVVKTLGERDFSKFTLYGEE